MSYEEKLFYQGIHMPTKDWRRFSKGQCQIEARIDLHGYRRDEARAELYDFLEHCQEEALQNVLVIHGRGEVLKEMVDEVCRHTPMVLAFISARPKDGGLGAIYVRLKKNRIR